MVVSCSMLFSACEADHFTSLENVTFRGEELTLNTSGRDCVALGTLTIGEKSYFVGFTHSRGDFFLIDLPDIPELNGDEAHRWEWDFKMDEDYIPVDEYDFKFYLTLYSNYYNHEEKIHVPLIWKGTYDINDFPFYKSTTYVKLEIEYDYLSEREGTPSYAGKTIELKRQK